MVHKHRDAHKATIAKDVSPMRNMSFNKYDLSSSPNGGFQLGAKLAAPAATTTSKTAAAAASKWQYNYMVNNNRDQFNNMHFC